MSRAQAGRGTLGLDTPGGDRQRVDGARAPVHLVPSGNPLHRRSGCRATVVAQAARGGSFTDGVPKPTTRAWRRPHLPGVDSAHPTFSSNVAPARKTPTLAGRRKSAT